MTWLFSGFLLALFGLSLILITLSLFLLRGTTKPGETYPTAARFFLVALRLAIGWHCFVEGMEKMNTPNFSETYLRESVGPLSGVFRWMAGDRLIERVTLGPDDTFPDRLDREWNDYLTAFAAYYELDEEQLKQARGILDQRKSDTLTYLKSKSEPVARIAPFPPPLEEPMTMKQRLEEHDRLLERVRSAEAKFPTFDKDVHAAWKKAKDDLKTWRAGLKKSIDAQTDNLKKLDPATTVTINKKIDGLRWKLEEARNKKDAKAEADFEKKLDEETAKLRGPLAAVLTSEQLLKDPMPGPAGTPVRSWGMLEISDFVVRWGLIVLGSCLMLGLLSRPASLATALLLFSFYIAMVPMPGWPESPKAEGHYLLINKTLIEVIALLALTCMPTGRWAGLDGLLGLCCCGKAKVETPRT